MPTPPFLRLSDDTWDFSRAAVVAQKGGCWRFEFALGLAATPYAKFNGIIEPYLQKYFLPVGEHWINPSLVHWIEFARGRALCYVLGMQRPRTLYGKGLEHSAKALIRDGGFIPVGRKRMVNPALATGFDRQKSSFWFCFGYPVAVDDAPPIVEHLIQRQWFAEGGDETKPGRLFNPERLAYLYERTLITADGEILPLDSFPTQVSQQIEIFTHWVRVPGGWKINTDMGSPHTLNQNKITAAFPQVEETVGPLDRRKPFRR